MSELTTEDPSTTVGNLRRMIAPDRVSLGFLRDEGRVAPLSRSAKTPEKRGTSEGRRKFPTVVLGWRPKQDGTLLSEGQIGEIAVRGPSITVGYFQDPVQTSALFVGGWMRTGDLGVQWKGELYVTGRLKDVLIVAGRNLDPQALEWEVEQLGGVRPSSVAAFWVPAEDGEAVVVAVETGREHRASLPAQVRERLRTTFGLAPAEVVLLRPGSLPKTSSGKIRRAQVKAEYLDGKYRGLAGGSPPG